MEQFQNHSEIKKDEVILIVVSNGLPDFIRNAIASIRRCEGATTICIALPKDALAEVKVAVSGFRNVEFAVLEELWDFDYSAMTKYFHYGSKEFSRFTASKWKAIRYLLERGFSRVIYTDVDIAWIRSPSPILRQALSHFEIAIQTEGVESFPPQYCCGFMAFRNSEFVTGLLKHLEKLHALREEPADDQVVFNELVATSSDLLHRIHGLSELLFANGLSAGKSSVNSDILVTEVSPMIFHANWTIGLENKRLLLQRTGLWLVAEPSKSPSDKKALFAFAIVRFLGLKGRPIAQKLLKGTRFSYLAARPE